MDRGPGSEKEADLASLRGAADASQQWTPRALVKGRTSGWETPPRVGTLEAGTRATGTPEGPDGHLIRLEVLGASDRRVVPGPPAHVVGSRLI